MSILDLKPADLKLAVGRGTASFSMSRGSFRYGEILHKKKALRVSDNTLRMQRDGNHLFLFPGKPEGEWNRFWVTFPVGKEEHFYGCGETFSEFDLKGQKVRIWVAEHQNVKRITGKILHDKIFGKRPNKKKPFRKYESYYVQPTFVSSAGYYVHVYGNCFMEFDFTRKGFVTLYMRENCPIEIGAGESFEEVSELLSESLGRQKPLADWLYDGVILGMQGGTEEIERKLERAVASGVPVSGIWSQDWCGCRKTGFGYQVMWNWEWDRELYPDLDQRIPKWKEKGIRFLGYINPFLALEKSLYREAAQKGYCVKDREGKDYLVKITTFPAAMVDFTNPEAYAWYKELIKRNMIGLGMGGWMADFGEYLPTDCVLWSGEDPQEKHNEWPAIWAKMNREAIDECGVGEEVFFFTRAGYTDARAGHASTIAESPMMWNGDQHVDWSIDDGMPSVIPATLSLAMSGFGLCHSDIGGYTTVMDMIRSKELLLRWTEMNAFSPLMRTHEGNQPSRNVQYDADEELLEQMARMANVHVKLKDYLKACVAENAQKGIPVMRPVFYHYDEDWVYTEASEYLLGRDILVAPVLTEGAVSRTVRLPKDRWVHFFTGNCYEGGEIQIEAPIGCPPVFVRAGSEAERMICSQETVGNPVS